jgi:hypothetical protein
MLGYADKRRTREAAVFVAAIGTVLETDLVRSALAWAAPLVSEIPWTRSHIGRPLRAWCSPDAWNDCRWWMLEHTDHVLAVMTSRCGGDHVVGLHLLPSSIIDEWNRLMAPMTSQLPLQEVSAATALAELARAHQLTRGRLAGRCGRGSPELDALLDTRLRGVDPAQRSSVGMPELEALRAAFLGEAQLPDDPDVDGLLELLLDFREFNLGDDLLAWSPGLVEMFLLTWAPDAELVESYDFRLLPIVTWLWVRWALKRTGMADDVAALAAQVAFEVRPAFLARCHAALQELFDEEDEPAA